MINNSSLNKWNRLQSKNIDQQFTNTLINGLNCSPFEASAVLDTVYNVYKPYFEICEPLKPGQIRLQLVAVQAQANQSIAESKQITVTLTLNDEKEDLPVRQKRGIIGLRRHKIQRICREAFDQGGLLTVEDLAYRIFNCGERTICRDLVYFRKQDIFIPLRSTVHDMGRTVSHRLLIIKLWGQGKEYSEIKREACHSLNAIQNYVDKFKRTISLSKEGYDINRISFLLKLSPSLVEQYITLYKQIDFIEHREQELDDLFKKNCLTTTKANSRNQEVKP